MAKTHKTKVKRVFPCPNSKCGNGWIPTGRGTVKACPKCNGRGHIVKTVIEFR